MPVLAPLYFLELLPADMRKHVLDGSHAVALPAASAIDNTIGRPTAHIVESGIVRAYERSSDGRQVAIVYFHPGELIGGSAVIDGAWHLKMQTVTSTTLTRLEPATLQRLFAAEVDFARAITTWSANLVARTARVAVVRSLGSMRERLAFDLLQRVCDGRDAPSQLVFEVSHEELSEAVGTVREVVSRILADFRREGIVATSSRRIVVLQPNELAAIVTGLVS